MTQVLELKEEMFEQVISFLQVKFNNPRITAPMWRSLLDYRWRRPGDPMGFVLVDGKKVIGVLATIFSRMMVKGKEERFCNMSSWYVIPDYRAEGSRLLMQAMRIPDCTLTNMSSTDHVHRGLISLGFRPFETATRLISPLSAIPKFWRAPRIEVREIDERSGLALLPAERRLYNDHRIYPCQHLLVRVGEDTCYVIFNEKVSRYRFAVAHYIGNRKVFARTSGYLSAWLYWKKDLKRLVWDERLMNGWKMPLSKRVPMEIPKLFFSRNLEAQDISNVYSELLILGL